LPHFAQATELTLFEVTITELYTTGTVQAIYFLCFLQHRASVPRITGPSIPARLHTPQMCVHGPPQPQYAQSRCILAARQPHLALATLWLLPTRRPQLGLEILRHVAGIKLRLKLPGLIFPRYAPGTPAIPRMGVEPRALALCHGLTAPARFLDALTHVAPPWTAHQSPPFPAPAGTRGPG